MPQTQIEPGRITEFVPHPVRFIASTDFKDIGDFFNKVIPPRYHDVIASALFFKLWQCGLTITLPSEQQRVNWLSEVIDTGSAKLILDCIFHYSGDSEESPNRIYGGAVLHYNVISEEGKPRIHDLQLSFHT